MQIQITETASINVKPDLIVLNLNLTSEDKDYLKVIEISTEAYNNFANKLIKKGIDKNQIRNEHVYVSPRFKETNSQYTDRNEIMSYQMTQHITITISNDNKLLSILFNLLNVDNAYTSLNLSYKLKDETQYKETCILDAIEKCKEKANYIANKVNKKFNDILSIDVLDNNVSSVNMYDNEARLLLATSTIENQVDYNPKDIVVSSTVQMKLNYN